MRCRNCEARLRWPRTDRDHLLRDKQNQGQRFEQSAQYGTQQAIGLGGRIAVRPILIEPLPRLLAAEAFQPTAERRANFLRRVVPEVLLGKLRTIRHGALRIGHAIQLKRSADAECMTNRTAAAFGCRPKSTCIPPPDLSHINDLPCRPRYHGKVGCCRSRNAFWARFSSPRFRKAI